MSAKKTRSCAFCKKAGRQVNSCPVKHELGESTKCSESQVNSITLKLENIAKGLNADFRDMAAGMDSGAIAKGLLTLSQKGQNDYN